jgi:hypothetical protein
MVTIADLGLNTCRQVDRRLSPVEHGYRVAGRHQLADEARANKARATGTRTRMTYFIFR